MELIRIIALRDFAIEHYPRAAKLPKYMAANDYHMSLYGLAILVPPTASAIAQVAAKLLLDTTTLLIEWDSPLNPEDRQRVEAAALGVAAELCILTQTTIPWLSTAASPIQPASPLNVPVKLTPPAAELPPKGVNLTTSKAAELLHVRPQTMHVWSSTGSGPLQPVNAGRKLAWRSDDVRALMEAGWTARGRAQGT